MGATGLVLGVSKAVDLALDAVAERGRAWITGQVGSGRRTAALRLQEALGSEAVVVELIDSEEPDAAIAGLFSAASKLRDEPKREQCMRDWSTLGDGAARLAESLGSGATLIVLMPSSWEDDLRGQSDDLRQEAAKRNRQFLRGLTTTDLRIVWITSRTMSPFLLGDPAVDSAVGLAAPKNALALLHTVDWGAYAGAAGELEKRADEDAQPSPLALRLGVGVVALGGHPERVAGVLEQNNTSEALRLLCEDLVAGLAQDEHRACRHAVSKLLLARRPLNRAHLPELLGIPEQHDALITNCIGYGDDEVRVSHPVRTKLRRAPVLQLDPSRTEPTHSRFSKHFSMLDGKATVAETSGMQTLAWIEKIHHQARSAQGPSLDSLPCREMFWDRGRYLSRDKQEYAAAAEVYAKCVSRFRDDSYAHHYLAYNLERAGQQRKSAEVHFRRAVELERENPWWNSRLVTFLVAQGRLRAARTAWQEALSNVDPDGERAQSDDWLAQHLHHWVARGWLDAGRVADAFEVLEAIPERHFEDNTRLQKLRERVLDAVEADAIGGAVYPATVPMKERWTEKPRELPEEYQNSPLDQWFPGRIVHADTTGVDILYASRLSTTDYESHTTHIAPADWQRHGLGPSEEARGFVALGVYQNGQRLIRTVEEKRPERVAELPLAYFDRWRSRG